MRTMAIAAMVMMLAGCTQEADPSPPTCGEAMDHLYSMAGCFFPVGGQFTFRDDAVTFCEQESAVAEDLGCVAEWGALRSCLAGAVECAACENERAAADACNTLDL
jgi:hypothetical protein